MHLSNIDYNDEREMASPFGTAAAQAGKPTSPPTDNKNSTQGLSSSSRSNQDARDAGYSSNNYSTQNGSFLEDPIATSIPPTDGLIAPASSLSDLSPFAHAPPLEPSLASSVANSTISSAIKSVQSDSRSQNSSPIGQSIASAVTANETAKAAVAGAMAAAAAATISSPNSIPENHQTHQRQLRTNLSSPQEMQQQLLQHLFPSGGSRGGAGIVGSVGGPPPTSLGRTEPNSRDLSTSPVVYMHPSGIPRQSSSSNGSVLSSPSSPAAGGGAGGAFDRLGEKSSTPPFSFGGVQMSQEQLQKAALQALQSGQSYASTQLGQGQHLGGAAAGQPQQQATVADKLMAYHLLQQQQQMQQQQLPKMFPAMPAGVANPPAPLYLQDAALQALQQQSLAQQQQHYSSMYTPERRSLDNPFSSVTDGGGGGGVVVDNEGLNVLFPAARYSISGDSGGMPGRDLRANAFQKVVPGVAAGEQREDGGVALLQQVQRSTTNMPKVSKLTTILSMIVIVYYTYFSDLEFEHSFIFHFFYISPLPFSLFLLTGPCFVEYWRQVYYRC
jgi:hypothetical protein